MNEQALTTTSGHSRGVPAASWSDERLVRECLTGSDEAWCGLIEKYKNLIYSIPVKYRIPPDIANDIFQQVCFELVRALPQLRTANSVAAWLITITSHKCSDLGSREQRYQALGDAPEEAPVWDKTPDALALEVEREQILREVLALITPRCRALIQMLFFDSPAVPYEEVARNLGLAKGSIGFIRLRCLRQMRRLLEKRGFQ